MLKTIDHPVFCICFFFFLDLIWLSRTNNNNTQLQVPGGKGRGGVKGGMAPYDIWPARLTRSLDILQTVSLPAERVYRLLNLVRPSRGSLFPRTHTGGRGMIAAVELPHLYKSIATID